MAMTWGPDFTLPPTVLRQPLGPGVPTRADMLSWILPRSSRRTEFPTASSDHLERPVAGILWHLHTRLWRALCTCLMIIGCTRSGICPRLALLYLGGGAMSVHTRVCGGGVGNPYLQIAVLQDQPQRVQLDMYGQLGLGSLTAPSVCLLGSSAW